MAGRVSSAGGENAGNRIGIGKRISYRFYRVFLVFGGQGRISDSDAQCPSSFKRRLVSDGLVDDVPSFSTNRCIVPCLLANVLIFNVKITPGESFHDAHVAQPSSTACVFFAQHLPEIGPIGL
jgi:hypothetical protein